MDDEQDDIRILILVFAVGLVVFILGLAGLATRIYWKRCFKTQCYVCRTKVNLPDWHDGTHREKCFLENRGFLDSLSVPYDIRCPRCLRYLRLVPKNHGRNFECDNATCPVKGYLENTGYNRLNCFLCDYDICDSCAHRQLRILSEAACVAGGGVGCAWNRDQESPCCALCQSEALNALFPPLDLDPPCGPPYPPSYAPPYTSQLNGIDNYAYVDGTDGPYIVSAYSTYV